MRLDDRRAADRAFVIQPVDPDWSGYTPDARIALPRGLWCEVTGPSVHAWVNTERYLAPVIAVPLSFWRGGEGFSSDTLDDWDWCAFGVAWRPAGVEYAHFTHVSSDWLNIALTPSIVEDMVGATAGRLLALDARRGPVNPALGEAALALRRRLLKPDGPVDRLALEEECLALAEAALGTLLTAQALPAPAGGLTPAAFARVLERIETGLDGALGLTDLAREAGLSRARFAKAFRAHTGVSAHRFVLTRRVERAREALGAGTAPLADIAYGAGFASQSHMTSVFTQMLGVSPARYRAHIKG